MRMKLELKIEYKLEGKTVGYILENHLKLSGNIITKLKQKEGIFLNGINVRTNKIVSSGDELLLLLNEDKSEKIIAENIPIDIVYEDEAILVVNKPSGMATHPSKEHYSHTLANAVVYYLKNSAFRVITRLDKETSGVVLVAKNQLSAHRLNSAMRDGAILKEYVALVKGVPDSDEGIIDAPIGRSDGICRVVTREGKRAVTRFCVEKKMEDRTLVRLNPITGRTHQLRVHMKHIGTPICGDWLYGQREEYERMMLHCRKIEFMHPMNNKQIIVEAKESF